MGLVHPQADLASAHSSTTWRRPKNACSQKAPSEVNFKVISFWDTS
jgi:hypothetical protein